MDIQQLKLLAGRARGLLEQSGHTIGHNPSLDLIAALPGLRNWPEVQSFPDRVASCELDSVSAGRLAFRLKRKFGLELTPSAMLAALSPPGTQQFANAPQIWPTGPAPGVYITDSQDSINALLEVYEEATDGAVVYAERAGNHWDGSIDLGEGGLWSPGLERVPSGTLIVVGPLELNQQSWSGSSGHLEMACLVSQGSGHRVAVLIETPSPEDMFEDVRLMVQSVQPQGDDCDTALTGIVTQNGELRPRQPFAVQRRLLKQLPSKATPEAIPTTIRYLLKDALRHRTAGLLLFGSSEIRDHSAIEFAAASLAMTEHAGPAARIMPRRRSTPSKDWDVPPAIKALPFLPSIESAYDQGYRRMVFAPNYTPSELLAEFSKEVLLISGTYGSDVGDVFMTALRSGGLRKDSDLLAQVIAIVGVTDTPTQHGLVQVCDLYLGSQANGASPEDFSDMLDFVRDNRTLRWEDQMAQLLNEGLTSQSAIKEAFARNRVVNAFLETWDQRELPVAPAD